MLCRHGASCRQLLCDPIVTALVCLQAAREKSTEDVTSEGAPVLDICDACGISGANLRPCSSCKMVRGGTRMRSVVSRHSPDLLFTGGVLRQGEVVSEKSEYGLLGACLEVAVSPQLPPQPTPRRVSRRPGKLVSQGRRRRGATHPTRRPPTPGHKYDCAKLKLGRVAATKPGE